ncbi:fused putative transporter subunits of ABC superfamily: ATP-binding components [Sterolibacterium denitrificans]|uniref:Probable ATP-binding protein YheS n=1 Tax=Sterolibacterium denitrificans TaxID=157592 RepID=A0A7Z7HPW0_9PROT|nr:ATP-binding cassette domain-containing protein [Sterolibacterium denitrificans]SMB22789.1 fused putative transporter subunits of ABC superfamily: ATP-binding components [Sterolibacterium denitrificans]
MILLRKLGFARGGRMLVEDANLQLHPGWKVGLIGANGSGKSSFLALLRNELHAECGDLEIPAAWVVAHVAQETPALPDAALEFTLDGDAELRRIEAELAALESSSSPSSDAAAGQRIGELHGRLGEIGGYAARARAAALLHGLGFSDADFVRPVADFSGGWRVRLNLARALMCRSDLLLLDEPTNHLDLDAVLWLEDWLKSYPGTLLMISHDRDFLDAVVDHTLHLENRQIKLYSGGYSDFERQRAAQLALQQAMFEKQQRERAHLTSYIERFRAKATKARQAQSRIKALARMEDAAAAHVDTPFTFRFRDTEAAPDPLLVLEKAAAGYGERRIIDQVTLTLRPGQRLALLGRNGAGKSTLVKLLAGQLAPQAGTRVAAKDLKIGYFAQHQLEQLRPDETPLQHMIRLDPRTREAELRSYLGSFDFRGDQATAACGRFSGGEKSRLALAMLIWQRPNLLLLDEPTNHLDLEMREALNLALQEYEGCVVLVSHDRHLLQTTADELWLVADGAANPFDGDLDDYARWLATQRAATSSAPRESAAAVNSGAGAPGNREKRAEQQRQQNQQRTLQKEADKLERQLAAWQAEMALLETRLADPSLYTAGSDAALAQALQQRRGELGAAIAQTEERWLETQVALEAG